VAEADVLRGAAHRPTIAGSPRHAYSGVRWYGGGAARRARRARAHWSAAACSDRGLFRLATFDSENLRKLELK
jgi:hypothetical protein